MPASRLAPLFLALFALTTSPARAQIAPRIMIAVDTSGSMAADMSHVPTFGDGVLTGCSMRADGAYCGTNCTAGIDTDCDGEPNDSRMFIARQAITNMVLSTGDIEWALSRFEQDTSLNRSCLRIDDFECNSAGPFITSYGNPQCNSDRAIPNAVDCPFDWPSLFPAGCRPGSGGETALRTWRTGDPNVCTNYTGTCDGADILVGFPDMGAYAGRTNVFGILKWIDNRETNYNTSVTVGDFCQHSGSGDCELRPEGPTPLADLLYDVQTYMSPIRTADSAAACRPYSVILLTDGDESCRRTGGPFGGPDYQAPVDAADALLMGGIRTHVVGMAITGDSMTRLNDIAAAGGTGSAYFADNPTALATALADIVADSLLVETCNNMDDDCDTLVDEGFTKYCNRPGGVTTTTLCSDPGETVCNGVDDNCDGRVDEGLTNACGTCGAVPTEVCDGVDNDCDGVIDEGCMACTPTAEICDNLDQDCDGRIDEGVSRACGTNLGECTSGTQTCTAGTWGACSGTGPTMETCNNRDDDCDGVIDGLTRPCGSTVGECRPGAELCTGGVWGTCMGGTGPTTELCNAADDDCDMMTDEGNPGGGAPCGTAVGACTAGTSTCMGGMLVCTGGTGPTMETCNDLDDDCDGLVDEGNPGGGAACGATDVGECERGMLRCVMGGLSCAGEVGPRAEICDGLDNDCDTRIDEGNPEAGLPCGDDTGECTPGTTLCTGGMLVCDGGVGPTMEICNGLDDDCDGVPDDGLGVGAPCGTDTGECVPGMNVCRMGALVCEGEVGPIDELCDLLDNDCDGAIDEGLGLGMACGTSEGICEPGMQQCVDGRVICVGAVPPAGEVCDCSDNDCDGSTDEPPDTGTLCPPGSECIDCSCALPCMMSEFGNTCPTGRTPKLEGDQCWCVAPRCEDATCATETHPSAGDPTCAPDADGVPVCVCKNNECTFPCDGVVCSEGLVCHPDEGTCVTDDCIGLGCGAGERCDRTTGECVPDACTGVTCGATEACRDGDCEPSCATVECDDGERCRSGACVDDPCAGVTCGAGEYCDPAGGACAEDPCVDVRCGRGFVCDHSTGTCVDDPCNALHCPEGQICRAGECALETAMADGGTGGIDGGVDAGPTDDRTRVLATGGGGCECSASGSSPADGLPIGIALLVLLVLRRRRRSAALCVGVVLLAAVALGCETEPYCIDCVDEVDAGPRDSGPRDTGGGRVDTGPVDSGPPDAGGPDGCVPGAPELCNDHDDDCDENVDEGIDTSTDPNNCGGCGLACAPPHAFPECVGGVCGIASCDVGWYDRDGDLANGCEYRCLVSADDDTLCDLRDNDCDGTVDEDVAFDTDAMNCGSCGRICRFAHAAGDCSAGSCVLGACDAGFYDIDTMPANGCEYACTPATPATETCNARDDDCDGTIDEGDPGGGAACGSSAGECTSGTERCVGGAIVCMGATLPTTEMCNGLDDDCDGVADQGNPEGGALCGSGVGTCRQGRQTCSSGSLVCMGGTGPVAELCDGLDNDCDTMIDEGNPEGGAACGTTTGECSAGALTCFGGTIVCSGGTGPAAETCDGLDDDCDGATDETYSLMTDRNNCGMCGRVCAFANATAACVGGSCTIASCNTGYRDLNGMMSDGCEYMCDFAGSEVCNGRDDDCDGTTDESLTTPSSFCNPNGVCMGSSATCGGAMGWTCSYPATYESVETRCDGLDNDCDGSVDEPFPSLGASCTRGTAGACLTTGTFVCNSAGTGVTCNATTPPAPGTEACNDVDDDCDGRVDEAIPLSSIPTVSFTSGGRTVRIFRYEASRADASSSEPGDASRVACSAANVLPWTNVTWPQARAACCALNASGTCSGSGSGWRLCDSADWQNACESSTGSCTWSYSASCSSSQPLVCNGEEHDCNTSQPGDQDCLYPTGASAFTACYAPFGGTNRVYDMSGNVKEWTNDSRAAGIHELRGGAYNNVEAGRTCGFDFTLGDESFSFPNAGFRCCYY